MSWPRLKWVHAVVLALSGLTGGVGLGQSPPPAPSTLPAAVPVPQSPSEVQTPDSAESLRGLLGTEEQRLDLPGALRLAGVSNPQIQIARERITEAVALRQYAAAQILPTIQPGLSYDDHSGPLQQSNSNILKVTRQSLYMGAGAMAIAAGTVNIPGVTWNMNLSQAWYNFLVQRQIVEQRRFASRAVENEMLLEVARAYTILLWAEGRRSVALQMRADARQVVEVTSAYSRTGVGRQADLHRAQTAFERREAELREAEGQALIASAQLAKLLNLDPSVRVHPSEDFVVPQPVVPDPIPLPELLAIAAANRPELGEQRMAIRAAFLSLRSAKVLPFSPTLMVNFSSGSEGGGSNLVNQPLGSTPFAQGDTQFGKFSTRADFDTIFFWSLQNLGVTNAAMIRAAQSNLSTANLELLARLNMVRAQVADAYARTHARFARIQNNELAVLTSKDAFEEDTLRIKAAVAKIAGQQARPIELLDSLRLLADSRYEYLQSIVEYNLAQLELYVALGQPPPDMLARPVPTDLSKVDVPRENPVMPAPAIPKP